jgi:hypothetical protein
MVRVQNPLHFTLLGGADSLPRTPLAVGPAVFHNFTCMTVVLIRYDAARKAIAAAHRVDEVRQIRSRAEAVRVYAKQAGDFELQNQAAEIRIRAERRAGQLLLDMEKNPGTRGEGRPCKNGIKSRRSSRTTAYPPTLDEIGISKDQSCKWQRLAMLIDDATFERALVQAREKGGELTTAGLLREIKEIVTPVGVVAELDANVVASEVTRDLASPVRKQKLEELVRLRNRLNPTIRKNLMLALKSSRMDAASFEEQLSREFEDFPANGKAYQRVIRERMAEQPEPDLEDKRRLAADFKNAVVREISFDEAKNLILANEWLGTMGTTEFAYGLFFGHHLAGVVCFGRTAGTNVAASICGAEHTDKVVTLTRGCTRWWAHPHSGSFLVSAACREMTKKGYHLFVAYSDTAAGEIGTIFQSCNFLYLGPTSPTEKFRTPSGEVKDARLVSAYCRDRTGGTLKYRRTRAEQKELLIKDGCEFFKDGGRKHRYVGIYGDRRAKRILRRALKWEVLPYPKRQQVSDVAVEGQQAEFGLPIPHPHDQENVRPVNIDASACGWTVPVVT